MFLAFISHFQKGRLDGAEIFRPRGFQQLLDDVLDALAVRERQLDVNLVVEKIRLKNSFQ